MKISKSLQAFAFKTYLLFTSSPDKTAKLGQKVFSDQAAIEDGSLGIKLVGRVKVLKEKKRKT